MDVEGKNQSYSAASTAAEIAKHNQYLISHIFQTKSGNKTAAVEQLERLNEFTVLNTFNPYSSSFISGFDRATPHLKSLFLSSFMLWIGTIQPHRYISEMEMLCCWRMPKWSSDPIAPVFHNM